MRLLRADTEELKLESVKEGTAKYAILSHRWLVDEEEVTFSDVCHGGRDILAKQGWKKLEHCRRQAVQDGVQYIWADTCCIDKSSSQELTESINAMYRWYQNAECCYVYLNDILDPYPDDGRPHLCDRSEEGDGVSPTSNAVPSQSQNIALSMHEHMANAKTIEKHHTPVGDAYDPAQTEIELGSLLPPDPPKRWNCAALKQSEWFTRGWTLQEMLASSRLKFYSHSWQFIAELSDIAAEISVITGVHKEALTHERDVRSYSIAQRMSWAAGRLTTRVEDRAYSLLGLLDVSMGIIYGEGSRAFQRLQDELLRTTSDQSIFAFEQQQSSSATHEIDLLAKSPDCFKHSSDIAQTPPIRKGQFQVIGKEVHLSLLTVDPDRRRSWRSLGMRWKKRGNQFKAILDCCPEHDGSKLVVLNLFSDDRDMSYVRFKADVKRMERLDISALGNGRPVQRETLKVMMQNFDHHPSKTQHWVTVRCLVTAGKMSISPDEIPVNSFWNKDSNTLTIPCSDQIGWWPLEHIPNFSLLVSLDSGRSHSRLEVANEEISVEGAFLGPRKLPISGWGARTVKWYKGGGGAMIVALRRDGPSFQRQDVVIIELFNCGLAKGILHSANIVLDRLTRPVGGHDGALAWLGSLLLCAVVIVLFAKSHIRG